MAVPRPVGTAFFVFGDPSDLSDLQLFGEPDGNRMVLAAFEQVGDGAVQQGMFRVAEIEQWYENEPSVMHFCMGNGQEVVFYAPVSEEENIEIDRSRAPALVLVRSPEVMLDRLAVLAERGGIERCVQGNHGIEIPILIGIAEGFGHIDSGYPRNRGAGHQCEPVKSLLEVGKALPDIRSDADTGSGALHRLPFFDTVLGFGVVADSSERQGALADSYRDAFRQDKLLHQS